MLIKKIDKLILVPFVGLFVLILGIAIFIILMQFFLIFFDELIGKGLGLKIYLQLFFYFGVTATPKAFPVATLVASLIAFGNLGESLELTALKSAGTSLLRTLLPLIVLVSLLSVFVFFSNGYLVPKITVRAYSLLYDLRKKKPSVAIREGVFYNGIPDYSIRVEKKLPDEKTLLDVIIYDHTKKKGNISMTIAESGELYTIHNDRYLVVELFNGHNYLEQPVENEGSEKKTVPSFYRTSFKRQKLLLDLDEFKLTRTNKDLFSYYHTTRTTKQLYLDIGERRGKINAAKQALLEDSRKHWPWLMGEQGAYESALLQVPANKLEPSIYNKLSNELLAQAYFVSDVGINGEAHQTQNEHRRLPGLIQRALMQSREYNNQLKQQLQTIKSETKDLRAYEIERHQRSASALGCLIMLLIGAPLGALIKKGGLGVPLLISTAFILLYYMADVLGTRWARIGLVDTIIGAWAPNLALLPFGIFFLRQAQKDSRLLDKDVYNVWIDRWLRSIKRKKQ
jgi:lipopolysaccharide export system permease protein